MTAPEQPVTGALTEDDLTCPCGHPFAKHGEFGCDAYVPPRIGGSGTCCTRTPMGVALAAVERILAARSQPPAERAGGEAIAAELLVHEDPPGWTDDPDGGGRGGLVYECNCGDVSPVLAHEAIYEADVEAAAVWHRRHVAEAIAALSTGTPARDEAVVKAEGSADTKALITALHAERTETGTTNIDCWACEAARSKTISGLVDALRRAQSALGATQAVLDRAVPDDDKQGELWRSYWRDRLTDLRAAALSEQPTPEGGEDRG